MAILMDLNRAAIFARVVEANGFSAAARLLGMPKTTVSKRVAELETELGVRLLNRTTRRLSLTEAGARVHAHCLLAIGHMAAAEREARAMQEQPRGMLVVGAPAPIGVAFLMPAITAFMAEHPGIAVTYLSVDDVPGPGDDRVDVLVWAGPDAPPGHAVRLVANVEIALYASVAYLAANPAPTVPGELQHHQAVVFTQSLAAGRFAWVLGRGDEAVIVEPAAAPRFRSNDAGAILAAVAADVGIGGLPVRFVEAVAPPGRLVRLLLDWRVAPIELKALYRDGSSSSLKTRLFLAFVEAWFRRL